MPTYEGAYGTATVHDVSDQMVYWSYHGSTMSSHAPDAGVTLAEHMAGLLAVMDADILAAEVAATEGEEV